MDVSVSTGRHHMGAPYYQDDYVTLYHGDCLEQREWLVADVLVTDPPYGMRQLSGWDSKERVIANDEDTSARDAALTLWGAKPAAVFGTWKVPRPRAIKNLVVWDKTRGTGTGMGDLNASWGNSHEEIYILGAWKRGGNPRHPSVISTSDPLRELSRVTGHPTPKPVGLMEKILTLAPAGVIADPFAGSGATLVAGKRLGRKVVSVELEEKYCELIAKRCQQEVLDIYGGAA